VGAGEEAEGDHRGLEPGDLDVQRRQSIEDEEDHHQQRCSPDDIDVPAQDASHWERPIQEADAAEEPDNRAEKDDQRRELQGDPEPDH
jgi:hypothetical protein